MKFKKYKIAKNILSKELCNFIYEYLKLSANADYFLTENNFKDILLGKFNDPQSLGTYSKYSDRVMETLLIKLLPIINNIIKLDLVPTYSYTRLYKTGDELKIHKDRTSCEISITLNLGGDQWPIFLKDKKNIKVKLNPGDMLIYRGCEIEHWREPFKGKLCGQVFLHYNDKKGIFKETNYLDKRPLPGLPENFRL